MTVIHATFAFVLCVKIKSLMSSMKNCLPLLSTNADNQFPKHIAAAGTVAVLSLRYTVTKFFENDLYDRKIICTQDSSIQEFLHAFAKISFDHCLMSLKPTLQRTLLFVHFFKNRVNNSIPYIR